MASPILIKTLVTLATDKKIRKQILMLISIILSPLILIIVFVFSIGSAAANHNVSVVELCFNSDEIPTNMSADYKNIIENMRNNFKNIDLEIENIINENEVVGEVDEIRIKSIFFSLFIEEEQSINFEKFVDCFFTLEEKIKTTTNDDGTEIEEVYYVYSVIEDLSVVYQNLNENLNLTITTEDIVNANEIYYRIKYGTSMPTEMDGSESWIDWNPQLSQEEMEKLYNDLPTNELGAEVLKFAMQRLGDPYSQEKRGQGNYVDCSYLTMWAYRQVGINIPSTAASQAQWCVENKLTISKNDLQVGDLIFWSYEPNGRFMNIGHVGIYAGNGKVVDASSTKKMVVYRDLFDENKQVLYARPSAIKN